VAEEQVETQEERDERRQWRMAAMQLVRQYPDPVLRSSANPIADVDDEVRRLAQRMGDVMLRSHGVGLAGPQVGVLRRIFVYRLEEHEVRVLVNPLIEERASETATDTEGCLSLLGGELTVPVERAVAVRVTGFDTAGDEVDLDLEAFGARVVQHELDHLDGVLMIDRAEPEERRGALRELRLRAG
jgi:peptide deformylase